MPCAVQKGPNISFVSPGDIDNQHPYKKEHRWLNSEQSSKLKVWVLLIYKLIKYFRFVKTGTSPSYKY